MHVRCFLALELPVEARLALSGLAQSIVDGLPDDTARIVPPGILHVTLAFLGNRDAAERAVALERLQETMAEEHAFSLHAGEVAPFGGGSALASVVTGADVERLARVRAELVRPLVEQGLLTGERPQWRPHVTIVRSRGRRRLHEEETGSSASRAAASPELPFVAMRAALFESSQVGDIRHYEPVHRVELPTAPR
jgi:2'-5' RNA ligase